MADDASNTVLGGDASASGGAPGDGTADPVNQNGAPPDGGDVNAGDANANSGGDANASATDNGSDSKPPVPEKYELKLPEGSPLDKAAVEQFEATAKELGLTNEQAQKLVEYNSQLLAKHVESQIQAHTEQVTKWADAVKADPEIGGEAFDANVSHARRALEKFATPEFKKILNDTGYGNHPELVRVFVRIGKAMAEDGHVRGDGAFSGDEESITKILYPNT